MESLRDINDSIGNLDLRLRSSILLLTGPSKAVFFFFFFFCSTRGNENWHFLMAVLMPSKIFCSSFRG